MERVRYGSRQRKFGDFSSEATCQGLVLKALLERQKAKSGFAQRWHSGIASNRGRRCVPSD